MSWLSTWESLCLCSQNIHSIHYLLSDSNQLLMHWDEYKAREAMKPFPSIMSQLLVTHNSWAHILSSYLIKLAGFFFLALIWLTTFWSMGNSGESLWKDLSQVTVLFLLNLLSSSFLWYFLVLALENTMSTRSLSMFPIHLWFHRCLL